MSRGAQGLILVGALLAGLPPLPEGCPILEAIPPAPPKLPVEPQEGDPEPRNRHQRRKAQAAARRAKRRLR